MRLILLAFLLAASPEPPPITWASTSRWLPGKAPTVIVVLGEECMAPTAMDATCIYVRVSLRGGDTLVVNRQTGATERCHTSIYEAAEKCKP